MDFREQDARAVGLAVDAVDTVSADQWTLPTPCAPWSVRDLVAHMIGQNLRFGAAVRGQDPDEACPLDGGDIGPDPAETFQRSAAEVRAAFGGDIGDRIVLVPELGRELPAHRVVGAHFLDFLAHQWDVAVSVGATVDVPEDLVTAGTRIAEALPEAASEGPDAAFAPAVKPLAAGGLDRFLGLVGRDPTWRP